MNMITVKRYCELSGETIAAVNNRIARGIWRKGLHYSVVARRRRINLKEVEKWAGQPQA